MAQRNISVSLSTSETAAKMLAIAVAILNSVAFVGNIFVCNAIIRNRRLRQNMSNTFVFALAMSDIIIASLVMPFTFGTTISGEWVFGWSMCQIQGFSMLTFAMISLHTMNLISINRYYCICKRSKYQALFKKHRTVLFIICVWLISLFGSVPPFFLDVGGYSFQPKKSMCLYTFEANIPYTIFIEVVYIGVPLSIIMTCYSAVFKEVYRNNQVFVSTQENINQLRSNVREAKISKTLAGVILAFVLCWVPISVVDFIDVVNGQPVLPIEVYRIYTILAFVSSSVNPFIYGLASRTFLHEYKAIIKELATCRFLICRRQTIDGFNSDIVSAEVIAQGGNPESVANDNRAMFSNTSTRTETQNNKS